MHLYRHDELLPVWGDDFDADMDNSFDSFWPISGNNASQSDSMFLDHEPRLYNNWQQTNDSGSLNEESGHFLYSNSADYSNSSHSSDSELDESVPAHASLPNQFQPESRQLQEQLPHQQHYVQTVPIPYMYYSSTEPAFIQAVKPEYVPSNPPCDQQPTEDEEEFNPDDAQYEEQEPYASGVYNDNTNCNHPGSDEEYYTCGAMEVDDPVDFKLPASKTPIMEAMVVCAINGWGLSVLKSSPSEVIFRVTDFDRYYRVSRAICSKHRPTEDIGSRVKSLRRWFINFPKKKDRQENPSFSLSVKPNTCKKVHGLIERNSKLLNSTKMKGR